MKAKRLIQKFIIESNLTDLIEETPELARFFDSSGKLVNDDNFQEVLEIVEDKDIFYDAVSDFRYEHGERIENFGIYEGDYPSYYKAFDIGDKTVAWEYQYGGGKHFEYDSDWLEDAFFVKRMQQARIVYIYKRLE